MEYVKKPSILVVDDETANLMVLDWILSQDYSVYTAKSGEQALPLAANIKPNLIILDIVMPGLDGFDVLKTLKAVPETADIPVIFITGLDNEGSEEKGFSLGAVDYITKPFKAVTVKARVSSHVKIANILNTLSDDLIRISSVVEGSPQFVLYMSSSGKVEYMNPACSEISGFTKEEFAESGLRLILSEEDLLRLNREYLPDAIKHKRFRFEMRIICKDGESRYLAFSAFAAVLRNGETGAGLLAMDVTDMKRVQREMAEAKEQAEYYNKAKSDFLSRMSHEMRTPMNAVIGMTSLARTETDDRRRRYCLDIIDKSSQNLMDIINDILDVATIDAGNFDLFSQSFRFHEAMRSVMEEAASPAREKGLKFLMEVDDTIPEVLISDERRLKQILAKLLSNAVKFTPKGGTVSLRASRIGDVGETCAIRFEVNDTGIGISAAQLAHLWDAFEQADNSITRTHGGIGLGLTIVRHIVAMMDGDIQAESEPGRGTRFICTIRIGVDTASAREKGGDNSASALAGKRILVVDDVAVNREIVLALLESVGATIDGAQDGAEAVEMFLNNNYDIVLMDLHMPVMNGFEAARRMRASGLSGADSLPIIAVTADVGSDVAARCMEAGMNGCLGKPISYVTLVEMITRHLCKKL